MLPGVGLALAWVAVTRFYPVRLSRVPTPKPRARWVYLSAGPLLYGCVSAIVISAAWLIGRGTDYAGLWTIAVSVMSAFALGAALMFLTARTG